jgi:hypothetical protein
MVPEITLKGQPKQGSSFEGRRRQVRGCERVSAQQVAGNPGPSTHGQRFPLLTPKVPLFVHRYDSSSVILTPTITCSS